MSIEEVEKQIRESAPLSDRLTDCKDRIEKMCAEGRPPKMSIPAQWNDDDLFICTTLSDAEAVERQLAMKQDDWLKECHDVMEKKIGGLETKLAKREAEAIDWAKMAGANQKQINKLAKELEEARAMLEKTECYHCEGWKEEYECHLDSS